MKHILASLLFFWTLALTSTWSANERMSYIPTISTQLQRQKIGRYILLPKTGRRDVQRLVYLKHLLELNCLKELCNHNYCNPGQGCLSSYDAVRPIPPPTYDRNQYRDDIPTNRGYHADDRMIFGPPTVYFINKPVNAPVNNPAVHDSGVISPHKNTKNVQEVGIVHQNTENILFGEHYQVLPQEGEGRTTEERLEEDYPGVLETDDLPKTGHATHEGFYNQARSNITSNLLRHPVPPNRINQYEVEEIVDEKPEIIDVPIPEGQMKRKPDADKPPDVKGSKLKSTLKGLLNPFINNEMIKQTYDLPHSTTVPTRNFSSHHRSREFVTEKPPHEQSKQPESLFQEREPKTTEETTVQFESNVAISNFSKFNLKSDRLNGMETLKSTTEKFSKVSFSPSGISTPDKKSNHTNLLKSLTPRQKAIDIDPSESLDALESLNLPDYATIADRQPSDHDFIPSERTVENSTTHRVPESGKVSFVTSSEIQTTVISQSSREFLTTRTNLSDEPTGNFIDATLGFQDNSATSLNLESFDYFSEATMKKAELTTTKFEEFTDRPLLFDLFPEVRKDPDAKNSRKMHFELRKTTKPSQTPEEISQRRSDILINENVDYLDYDNNLSSSNYLEKLRENNSFPALNFSSDSIVPLIPTVINDLREGKISPEDIPILSETFGRHWPTVLALSNDTNLDMLPLMKMKNEKDLENVLKSFLSEPVEKTTNVVEGTSTQKADAGVNKNFYYDLYEYMDKDLFKDLYKDLPDIQEGKKPDLTYEGEEFERDGSRADLVH